MAGLRAWTASNAAERATWCGCIHGSDEFLTWHRMFVYYFERVLAQAAGVPSLRLPFWDYSTSPALPAIFRSPTYRNAAGATVPNPLYREARRINTGGALASSVTSSANAMRATTYGSFRTRLEATPHGAVHCALAPGGCPNGLMGAVPSAGNDPIFWLQDANIDRLYECWLGRTGRYPAASAVLDRTYSFVDRDGSIVTRRARDMLRASALGYRYAAGGGCSVPASGARLYADGGERMAPTATLAVPPGASTLRIDGVHFPAGVMLEVWIIGPNGTVNVGTLAAFGAEHHGAAFEFGITDAMRSVGATKRIGVALVSTDGIRRVRAAVPAARMRVE